MHLLTLNVPNLLLSLWHGTLKAEPGDDKTTWDWAVLKDRDAWEEHGALVQGFRKYLPSEYDCPPHNPAEKINSGYKAAEYLTYIYGYLPLLLRGHLPERYLNSFYKLVHAVQIFCQHSFEELYVQQKASQIHFVHQCMHTLWHMAHETCTLGPMCLYAQWTMEQVIGYLGQDIQLHSHPYANLAQLGVE
ncbi:hypothetical protein P691DRAFT_797302 [Macrolepiota fuliginosa MF-IS2]|uniref:Uncharacterized protein n=1 Tax=Macrolepiota fuliginosa MF-IS2 TaxID=1400762 RepID=A0A9P5X5I6_9AGAR|nr:hypothetical protein P691DRAFT_797302 [Macrolepiota fuliginosa MF-IS2]